VRAIEKPTIAARVAASRATLVEHETRRLRTPD
jgi:hypothetical protein